MIKPPAPAPQAQAKPAAAAKKGLFNDDDDDDDDDFMPAKKPPTKPAPAPVVQQEPPKKAEPEMPTLPVVTPPPAKVEEPVKAKEEEVDTRQSLPDAQPERDESKKMTLKERAALINMAAFAPNADPMNNPNNPLVKKRMEREAAEAAKVVDASAQGTEMNHVAVAEKPKIAAKRKPAKVQDFFSDDDDDFDAKPAPVVQKKPMASAPPTMPPPTVTQP